MNSHDGKDNNNHHYEKRERFPDLDHVDVDEANAVVQALRTHDMMDITTTVIMLVIILQIAIMVLIRMTNGICNWIPYYESYRQCVI
jgi:hypothetical protein